MTINSLGVVTNVQDYYAGVYPAKSGSEVLRSYNNSTPNEKYKFTGKERDTETDLDYFGARYYDSELGRWTSIDPLADKYPQWSSYNYCMDNPLKFIDPNGTEGDWTKEDLIESLRHGANGFEWVKKGYRANNFSWNTPQEAALAAANDYGLTNENNKDREWGSYIIYNSKLGKYGFTDFTIAREVGGKEIWNGLEEVYWDNMEFAKQGLLIVGIWHQHPKIASFSFEDGGFTINTGLKVYATFPPFEKDGIKYPKGAVVQFDPDKYKDKDGNYYQAMRNATVIIYPK